MNSNLNLLNNILIQSNFLIYMYVYHSCLPVGPLVARLEAIELTDPLLIDTDECWEWLRADDGRLIDC